MKVQKATIFAVGLIFAVALMLVIPSVSSQPDGNWTRWEYLSVQYSQLDLMGNGERAEFVMPDREPYVSEFSQLSGGDCGEFDTECLVANFRGRAYYLGLLGQDGWELINLDNNSTEFTYEIEMIFKRPVE